MPRALAMMCVLFAGCGPSLRGIHRGDVYFERCYAADLAEHVPLGERRACWEAWITHYRAGQPKDRVDYVRERLLRLDPERAQIVALATGGVEADPVPLTDPAPEVAAEAETLTAVVSGEELPPPASNEESSELATDAAPLPAEAVASGESQEPEPQVREQASEPEAERPRPTRPPRRAVLPASESNACTRSCRPAWDTCTERCNTGDRYPCMRACRLQVQTCARACY